MTVVFSKLSMKALARMDKPTRERIIKGISGIPQGDIKLLRGGSGYSRLRIGYWRVIFECTDENTIFITRISPRGDAYKGV